MTNLLGARFATCIDRIDWECKRKGWYRIVGSCPATCDRYFETEAEALEAILADPWIQETPDQPIQLADRTFYNR